MNLLELVSKLNWQEISILALGSALTALFMGKAIRRLVLLPFEWLASKTETRIDDTIIQEASKDLGIDISTLEKSKHDTEHKE